MKLFHLEEQDRIVLNDPVGRIVTPGGQVYLAASGDRIVGCAGLIRLNEDTLELSKMVVATQTRGQGVGRKLLSYVLQQARELGACTVVLGSSTQLQNAVHLYESLGFRHVPASELPIHYERATVWMKLDLV